MKWVSDSFVEEIGREHKESQGRERVSSATIPPVEWRSVLVEIPRHGFPCIDPSDGGTVATSSPAYVYNQWKRFNTWTVGETASWSGAGTGSLSNTTVSTISQYGVPSGYGYPAGVLADAFTWTDPDTGNSYQVVTGYHYYTGSPWDTLFAAGAGMGASAALRGCRAGAILGGNIPPDSVSVTAASKSNSYVRSNAPAPYDDLAIEWSGSAGASGDVPWEPLLTKVLTALSGLDITVPAWGTGKIYHFDYSYTFHGQEETFNTSITYPAYTGSFISTSVSGFTSPNGVAGWGGAGGILITGRRSQCHNFIGSYFVVQVDCTNGDLSSFANMRAPTLVDSGILTPVSPPYEIPFPSTSTTMYEANADEQAAGLPAVCNSRFCIFYAGDDYDLWYAKWRTANPLAT